MHVSGMSPVVYASTAAASQDGVWMCPFCYTVLHDEHSFDEHVKKVLLKLGVDVQYHPVVRRSAQNKRAKCVFDFQYAQHQLFISPWKIADPTTEDRECCRSFIYHLRQLLTPGALAVFGGGTGHVMDVQRYIESCVRGVLPQ